MVLVKRKHFFLNFKEMGYVFLFLSSCIFFFYMRGFCGTQWISFFPFLPLSLPPFFFFLRPFPPRKVGNLGKTPWAANFSTQKMESLFSCQYNPSDGRLDNLILSSSYNWGPHFWEILLLLHVDLRFIGPAWRPESMNAGGVFLVGIEQDLYFLKWNLNCSTSVLLCSDIIRTFLRQSRELSSRVVWKLYYWGR